MKTTRKKRPPRSWVWIARDAWKNSQYRIYRTGKRPKLIITNYSGELCIRFSGHAWLEMCAQGFEKMFQFRLPPGAVQKVRVRFHADVGSLLSVSR